MGILKDPLALIIISNFKHNQSYYMSLRLFRIFGLLLRDFVPLLTTECEILLTFLIKMLDRPSQPWQRVLALEVLRGIFQNFDAIR